MPPILVSLRPRSALEESTAPGEADLVTRAGVLTLRGSGPRTRGIGHGSRYPFMFLPALHSF